MVDTPETTGASGWIVSAIVVAGAIIKEVWAYAKKRSDNETKIKLNESDGDRISKQELSKQYNELLKRFTELEEKFDATERQLDRALDTFDILFPLIENLLKDKPEYKTAFENALKNLKK